ncbi:FTR1 family protein [Corynebacterium mendelii]|uniref:FTR1 family iron permease n=1 Tax=Corynebacterium mendelii TaxID=2765362 RepID=A0A939IUJ7_9CORY|nr:FTR1 family protein [Corynebacterium mendelii]MBN9643266.1 FTR1 family iron permease [Corynebacterium mendelii]
MTASAQQAPTTTPVRVEKDLPVCTKGVSNPDGSTRTYQDYALCMAAEINKAIDSFGAGNYEQAVEDINEAYFGWYENALEPPSMTLPGNRKVKMEGRFTRVKLAIRNNPSDPSIPDKLDLIKTAVARDAMVLDGALPDSSPESAGKKLLTEKKKEPVDESKMNSVDFITAFTLLLREGLEALLVVTAIILYLVTSGNRKLCKAVYLGVAAAVVLSFVLAWGMQKIVGGAGAASEMIEGFTMFIAVAMLFYVSNWMLGKTSGQNWQHYIQGMVTTSVSSGAAKALVFAAFLAVIREGAELVLFYTAAFAGGGHNPLWIGLGFGAGIVVLAVIFVIFRYGGARMPVRPIFMGTSILLFIMCISFVGKGVQELKEASFILGDTNLPWMKYYFPELGIYPQAETILPQLILLVASVWIIVHHTMSNRSASRDRDTAGQKNPTATPV